MSLSEIRWSVGIAMMLVGWLLPRWVAGTRLRLTPALPLDLLLPCVTFAVVLLLSARPLLAGTVTLALGAGWARADHDKRRMLAEPVVFTDVFQAFDIFRHPQLALPFPHKGRVVLAALATLGFFAMLIRFEPPAIRPELWVSLLCTGVAAGLVFTACMVMPISHAAWRVRELSADPKRDTASHGSLATLLLYGLFARHERDARRSAAKAALRASKTNASAGPVVLVQNESFFDARRLHPDIPPDLLPHFDRACRDGAQWGRFDVPSWGANTVRTEFAVLSGLNQEALGFDRFNPYYRFANEPLATLASTLRAEGYHTVCLHPFDRRFYRRDQVLPKLGFDEFLGEELFEHAPRINGYVTDVEVAKVAVRLIRERGPKVFLFIITMENHGPWSGPPDARVGDLSTLPLDDSERLALNHYLAGLVHGDEMLGLLRAALETQAAPAVLGFYGDHLPGFPTIFPKLQLSGTQSDYVIWRTGNGCGSQQRLSASGMAAAMQATR